MYLRFYIDPQTDAPHIYNHDVDENEVEAVLQNPGEDRLGREGSEAVLKKLFRYNYFKNH